MPKKSSINHNALACLSSLSWRTSNCSYSQSTVARSVGVLWLGKPGTECLRDSLKQITMPPFFSKLAHHLAWVALPRDLPVPQEQPMGHPPSFLLVQHCEGEWILSLVVPPWICTPPPLPSARLEHSNFNFLMLVVCWQEPLSLCLPCLKSPWPSAWEQAALGCKRH